MPKSCPPIIALCVSVAIQFALPVSGLRADDSKFLNFAIFDLPPEYFADIPLAQRGKMLKLLSKMPGGRRLDYENSYLHWYSDGGSISASSQLRLKLFPRDSGRAKSPQPPYVFVHMPKPFADGSAPAADQSFVLLWGKGGWENVTDQVLPKEIDRTLHLRPERNFFGIRVYGYEEFARRDGRGQSYTFADEASALYVWKNNRFEKQVMLPSNSEFEAPFDAEKLAAMALPPIGDDRALAEMIVHAALAKDDRFRYLLGSEKLNRISVVAMALACYQYAIDQDEGAVDFIVRRVAEEGRGDTNSLWIMSYFDEWEKTIEAYKTYSGGDGAAGEASYLWMQTRKHLFPEHYRNYVEEQKAEND
ncbi:MAG: hypothetical protein ACR2RV_26520 [Verrucomicrobiales bacterium]